MGTPYISGFTYEIPPGPDEEMSDKNPPESEDETGDEENQNQEPVYIEDEDDFKYDYPDLDNVIDPTSQDVVSLLNSLTFKFMRKFFSSSRNYLDLFILVPKASLLDTLATTLDVLRGRKFTFLRTTAVRPALRWRSLNAHQKCVIVVCAGKK